LNVDNVRFIGDVGWRQNNQTFDAVTAKAQPVKGLDLLYSYLWEVNRIFGDVEGLPAGFTDFDSDSHAFHASYAAHKYVRITGYAYLLDLVNDLTANQSCATYGGFVNGTVPVHEKVGLSYRGEFALQSDYADSTQDYDTEYYNLELGVNVKPVTVGGGYEVLGSDNNVGFRTPLATLHAFNGWADVFLNTPGAGLRDWYAFVASTGVAGASSRRRLEPPADTAGCPADASSGVSAAPWSFFRAWCCASLSPTPTLAAQPSRSMRPSR
jgi:hypothetical protein